MALNFGDTSPICIFCGATKQTEPPRKFVTNAEEKSYICASCLKEAVLLINNDPGSAPPAPDS